MDEAILVPIHQDVADLDCIYSLNEVGSFLWKQLEIPRTKSELHADLLNEYDTDSATVALDLDRFLEELISLGAVNEV